MSLDTTKEIGDFGERIAVHYLRLRGYTVKERNWRAGKAELDIIASTLRRIVFVEVKTRSYEPEELDLAPPPSGAVNADKKRLTRGAARAYSKHRAKNQRGACTGAGSAPKALACKHPF